jgi:hypothetical protein
MYEIEDNQGPTYRLDGKALEIAKELHEYSKEVQKEYRQVALQIAEFSQALMLNFDEKHNDRFQDIFRRLAEELSIPVDEIRKFHLDATYIDDHNIAFMKQGPINDNVMVMDPNAGDDQLEMFDGEEDTLP